MFFYNEHYSPWLPHRGFAPEAPGNGPLQACTVSANITPRSYPKFSAMMLRIFDLK